MSITTGRNEPCPCGSGKKYKKCCLATDSNAELLAQRAEMEMGEPLTEAKQIAYWHERERQGLPFTRAVATAIAILTYKTKPEHMLSAAEYEAFEEELGVPLELRESAMSDAELAGGSETSLSVYVNVETPASVTVETRGSRQERQTLRNLRSERNRPHNAGTHPPDIRARP